MIVPSPVAVQVRPSHLWRQPDTRLMLAHIRQDADQPPHRGPPASFPSVSQVDIDPIPDPFFHPITSSHPK
jgi:hypothetical protein